jgi:hypothetical protein
VVAVLETSIGSVRFLPWSVELRPSICALAPVQCTSGLGVDFPSMAFGKLYMCVPTFLRRGRYHTARSLPCSSPRLAPNSTLTIEQPSPWTHGRTKPSEDAVPTLGHRSSDVSGNPRRVSDPSVGGRGQNPPPHGWGNDGLAVVLRVFNFLP